MSRDIVSEIAEGSYRKADSDGVLSPAEPLVAESLTSASQVSESNLDPSRWLAPFVPLRFLTGSHLQTLVGNYWRRPPLDLAFESHAVEVDPSDESRVLCVCHWQPQPVRAERLTILLVHGLEGSSNSGYMLGVTRQAWDAGCNVIRMNMRNCGGTEKWTPTLYHSGMSGDVNAVLRHFVAQHGLQRVAMAGYSMGGNVVLKLAGELGAEAPQWLVAAVGISPAADLAPSADALHEPANRVYEWNFLRNLMRRFGRKAKLFPERYAQQDASLPIRSIREFDERITARYSGFTGADDYYYRASSARVMAGITMPTLIVRALDDPFIRMEQETEAVIHQNPAIRMVETAHGGHCAFLAESPRLTESKRAAQSAGQGYAPLLDSGRHWAETTLVRFLLATAGHPIGS